MASIQDLMNSIAQMEGFNVSGSVSARNNNPGNLRYAPTQIGSEQTVNGTFATFATAQDGWNALADYINSNSGLTLRDFTYKYAPPTENQTSNYLNFLTSKLGVSADATVGDIVGSGSGTNLGSDFGVSSLFTNLLSNTDGTGQGGTILGMDSNTMVVVGLGALVLWAITS
jgi:hypothetical protein